MQQQPTVQNKGFNPNDPKYQGFCGSTDSKKACIVLGSIMLVLNLAFIVLTKFTSPYIANVFKKVIKVYYIYGSWNTIVSILTIVLTIMENVAGLMACRIINIVGAVLFGVNAIGLIVAYIDTEYWMTTLSTLLIIGAIVSIILCVLSSYTAIIIKTFRLFLIDCDLTRSIGNQNITANVQPVQPWTYTVPTYSQPPPHYFNPISPQSFNSSPQKIEQHGTQQP